MKKLLITTIAALLSVAAVAQDDSAECKVVITANDAMQFDSINGEAGVKEFTIDKAACPEFTIELKHVGKTSKEAMGHNVVITKTENLQALGQEAMQRPAEDDYLTPDDERVIAHTDMIGGGEETEVTFDTEALDADGDYSFFCSKPGHYAVMQGKVIVK